MVAKINSGSSAYGVFAYNQQKVDKGRAKVISTNRMIEPKTGVYDIAICMSSFEPYLLANRRTEKPVLHISLNPDPGDKISDEKLSEIADVYMSKMGYGDQPYIVFKHEDIHRHHIHIVSLRVDENGRKLDHNFERRRSMDICRALEQQYGLIPADQKRRHEGASLKAVDYQKGDVKRQIANVIRPAAQSYHFQSLKEYKTLLFLYNIHAEEVRGEANGKQYRGLVYFALNSRGEKEGSPFNASSFGKSVGINALEKRIEKSAGIIKRDELKERCKKVITSAMKSHPDRTVFERVLAKNDIAVLFRENAEGRIYGVTFIDHRQKAVFNGSRLGKEFSANVFNDLFNKKWQEKQFEHEQPQSYENAEDNRRENIVESLGSLFSVFLPEPSYYLDDNNEVAWKRKKKKWKYTNKV
jgi:hypothetical protein